MPVEELASTANVPEVWLQLERKAGVLHARWRAVEPQAWVEMGGPIEHAALQGSGRIGLTHQTFMPNVGSITLANFALEGASVAERWTRGRWPTRWRGPDVHGSAMLDETERALRARASLDALTRRGRARWPRLWWRRASSRAEYPECLRRARSGCTPTAARRARLAQRLLEGGSASCARGADGRDRADGEEEACAPTPLTEPLAGAGPPTTRTLPPRSRNTPSCLDARKGLPRQRAAPPPRAAAGQRAPG